MVINEINILETIFIENDDNKIKLKIYDLSKI
jgi:hypothetical protein